MKPKINRKMSESGFSELKDEQDLKTILKSTNLVNPDSDKKNLVNLVNPDSDKKYLVNSDSD